MPRALDSSMQAALELGVVQPAILAQLTFVSGTYYVWTGIGPLVYNGNTYLGVGSLAGLGAIIEGTEVRAEGTGVSLSGIDPTLYSDSMADVQLGAPANIWFAVLTQGTIIGAPYLLFSGVVDKPTVSTGADSITISLALENLMTQLQRPSSRRYTSADQHIQFSDDTAFIHVESLSDQALVWGE